MYVCQRSFVRQWEEEKDVIAGSGGKVERFACVQHGSYVTGDI